MPTKYRAILLYGIEIPSQLLQKLRVEEEENGYTSEFSWEDPGSSWKTKHPDSNVGIKVIANINENYSCCAYVFLEKHYHETEHHEIMPRRDVEIMEVNEGTALMNAAMELDVPADVPRWHLLLGMY